MCQNMTTSQGVNGSLRYTEVLHFGSPTAFPGTDNNSGDRGQKFWVLDPKYGGTNAGGGTGIDG